LLSSGEYRVFRSESSKPPNKTPEWPFAEDRNREAARANRRQIADTCHGSERLGIRSSFSMAARMCLAVALGDYGTGKTCLLSALASLPFSDAHNPTVGGDLLRQTVEYGGVAVDLRMADTAGHEKFSSLTPMMCRSKDVCLHVCSIDKPDSIQNLPKWRDVIVRQSPSSRPRSISRHRSARMPSRASRDRNCRRTSAQCSSRPAQRPVRESASSGR
jgi:hypothetical protein